MPADGAQDHDAWDRNRKGNVAEAAIAFHAARLGIQSFRPLLEHGRYDLVLEIAHELRRVQCKWAQLVGDVVIVRLVANRLTPAGYVRTMYLSNEIDAVAAYCAELDRCYFLPSELVAGRNAISLRIAPTRNGQAAGIRWAADYELSNVRARAAPERFPTTTTDASAAEPSRTSSTAITVAAHDFRDRFGSYLELAAGGDSITITRHGHPVARLVPLDDRTQTTSVQADRTP